MIETNAIAREAHRKREDFSKVSWLIGCAPFSAFAGIGMFYGLSLLLWMFAGQPTTPSGFSWPGVTYPTPGSLGLVWLLGICAAFAGSYVTALRSFLPRDQELRHEPRDDRRREHQDAGQHRARADPRHFHPLDRDGRGLRTAESRFPRDCAGHHRCSGRCLFRRRDHARCRHAEHRAKRPAEELQNARKRTSSGPSRSHP